MSPQSVYFVIKRILYIGVYNKCYFFYDRLNVCDRTQTTLRSLMFKNSSKILMDRRLE